MILRTNPLGRFKGGRWRFSVPWFFVICGILLQGTLFFKTFPPINYAYGNVRYLHVVQMAYRIIGGAEDTLPLKYLQFAYAANPGDFSRRLGTQKDQWELTRSCKHARAPIVKSCLSQMEFTDDTPVPFISVRQAAQFSPVGYLPYVTGAWMAMEAGLQPLNVMYAAQLTNIGVLLFLGFWLIRLTPVMKWPLAFLLLLPSMLIVRIYVMPDGMLMELCFLFLAIILNIRKQDRSITKKEAAGLWCLGVLIGLVKAVYFIYPLVIALIPWRNLASSRRNAIIFVCLLTASSVITANLWNAHVMREYSQVDSKIVFSDLANNNYQLPPNAWAGDDKITESKIMAVYKQPWRFLRAAYNHLGTALGMKNLLSHLVFYNLKLPACSTLPDYLIIKLAGLLLFACVLTEPRLRVQLNQEHTLDKWSFKDRALCLSVALSIYLLISLIILLMHRYVQNDGKDYIPYFQGRYFVPVIPLAMLVFYCNWPLKHENIRRFFHALSVILLIVFLGYFHYEYINCF